MNLIAGNRMSSWFYCFLLSAAVVLNFAGCDGGSTVGKGSGTANGTAATGDTDDHDHDHESHADHGPNHGHLITADSSDHGLEWTHSNSNDIIRIFLLDGKKEKNQPAKVDSLTISRATGNTSDKWVLTAVNPNSAGESAEYMLDSKELNLAMALGVNIEIKMGDKTVKATIPPHAPHDH